MRVYQLIAITAPAGEIAAGFFDGAGMEKKERPAGEEITVTPEMVRAGALQAREFLDGLMAYHVNYEALAWAVVAAAADHAGVIIRADAVDENVKLYYQRANNCRVAHR